MARWTRVHDLSSSPAAAMRKLHDQSADFATQLANHNVIFASRRRSSARPRREYPGQRFHRGLAAKTPLQQSLSIAGHFNRSAMTARLPVAGKPEQVVGDLRGEAYNVEQALPTSSFRTSGKPTPTASSTPCRRIHQGIGTSPVRKPCCDFLSDAANFAAFMRLLAPRPTAIERFSDERQQDIREHWLDACISRPSSARADAQRPRRPSNAERFALHKMEPSWRTASPRVLPRVTNSAPRRVGSGTAHFLLHDGRTTDLLRAIREHDSVGSEAHAVIENFELLSVAQSRTS